MGNRAILNKVALTLYRAVLQKNQRNNHRAGSIPAVPMQLLGKGAIDPGTPKIYAVNKGLSPAVQSETG